MRLGIRSGIRAAAWLAAVLVSTSATCEDAKGPEPPGRNVVTIKGRLTNEGVSCPAFRDRHGTLYTLAGSTEDFRPGDRVCVRGTLAETSVCQQGQTIAVDWIVPARMCP